MCCPLSYFEVLNVPNKIDFIYATFSLVYLRRRSACTKHLGTERKQARLLEFSGVLVVAVG